MDPRTPRGWGGGATSTSVPTHDDRVQRTTSLEDAICQNSHRTRDDGIGPWLLKKLNRQLRAFRSRKRQLQVGPWRVSHTFREKLYQFCTTPPRVWGQRGDFLTHPGRPALPQYQTQTKKCRKTAEQYLLSEHRCETFNRVSVNRVQQWVRGTEPHDHSGVRVRDTSCFSVQTSVM